MIGTANNHWLNTIFIFFESKILGTEIWKIRLHSAGAFILFSVYLVKICQRIPNKFMSLATILLVAYNTYTLDFFSLARGYGMGLAFGMTALYYILYTEKIHRNRLLIYILLCFSATAVYTQLYLLFAYGLYELFFVFRFKIFYRKKFIEYIKPLWLPFIFLAGAAYNIWYIKKSGDLNEGQTNGFFEDTIGVFLQRSYEPFLSNSIATLIGIFLILALVLCIAIPKKHFQTSISKTLCKLLLIAFLLHEFFFFALAVPYPFGRTALYFTVPLLLAVGIFIGELNIVFIKKYISPMLLIVIIFCQGYYILKIKNIHTTYEWWMGQDVSEALEKIKLTEQRDLADLSLLYYEGHNGVFQNYYNLLNGDPIFKRVNRIHLFHVPDDFAAIEENPNQFDYILIPDYDSVLNKTVDFMSYDSVAYYANMKTWLLKKTN